jgi:hypothetical protein
MFGGESKHLPREKKTKIRRQSQKKNILRIQKLDKFKRNYQTLNSKTRLTLSYPLYYIV